MQIKNRLQRLLDKIPLPRTENGLQYVIIQNGIITAPDGLTMAELNAMQPKPYRIIIYFLPSNCIKIFFCSSVSTPIGKKYLLSGIRSTPSTYTHGNRCIFGFGSFLMIAFNRLLIFFIIISLVLLNFPKSFEIPLNRKSRALT